MNTPLVLVAHGHGGSNHGCKSEDGSLVESRLTVPLASKIVALGRPLTMLATALDVDLTPAEVKGIAERAGCKVVVEVHFDSDPDRPNRNGAACYYRSGDDVAHALGANICAQLGGDWRAVPVFDPNYPQASGLVRDYDGFPVVVLEVAFLSSPTDRGKLKRNGALDTLAAKIDTGIETWYRACNDVG